MRFDLTRLMGGVVPLVALLLSARLGGGGGSSAPGVTRNAGVSIGAIADATAQSLTVRR